MFDFDLAISSAYNIADFMLECHVQQDWKSIECDDQELFYVVKKWLVMSFVIM